MQRIDKLDGNPERTSIKSICLTFGSGLSPNWCRNSKMFIPDLAYFVNPDPGLFGLISSILPKDMVYLLTKYKDLKDRIIMGSDWYMIEQENSKGSALYYRKMFFMLQEVSKKVNYDAWHQFAVVNPLRFLG